MRKITVVAFVFFIELMIPASVLVWMWVNGVSVSLTSFIDNVVYVHELPVGPIAGVLEFIFPTETAAVIAAWTMSFVEVALIALVVWLLFPSYREGRAIVAADWNRE